MLPFTLGWGSLICAMASEKKHSILAIINIFLIGIVFSGRVCSKKYAKVSGHWLVVSCQWLVVSGQKTEGSSQKAEDSGQKAVDSSQKLISDN